MSEEDNSGDRRSKAELLKALVTVTVQSGNHDEAAVLGFLRSYNDTSQPVLSNSEIEGIARQLGERLNIEVDRGTAITAKEFEPWLAERKREIEWGRWLAYKQLLLNQGRSPKVIETLDHLTDQILDFVGNPQAEGSWARRGLVLGDVQSGKTGTYLGLFNKAADAGFRLVILLAGNTEALRQQTQARVDEAFIGRDSKRQVAPKKGTAVTQSKLIGVGKIRKDLAQAHGLTTVLRDFRRSSYEAANIYLQTDAAHPYVFVLKKNKPILEAVIAWLTDQASSFGGSIPIPVLVLDDESDYASINTKEENDPTAINKSIRDILALFDRSSYVAFTATPFANIFIDHGVENDLFPRDYVYSLEAPSNYVGSQAVFGTTEEVKSEGLHELDDVEEHIPLRHKSGQIVTSLPPSLLEAVRTFFLANAVRDIRGQHEAPRAMLVNVSRFKNVQRQVAELLESEVIALKNAIQLHAANPKGHRAIAALEDTYMRAYATTGIGWADILNELPSSTSDIRVLLFNSDKDSKLAQQEAEAWDRPARMVAIGGDVLSRGLTLEGLTVSYFNRAVTASDTLMQMARWFGYRDGYHDLTRIWINADSVDAYRFAADSIEDLRRDLRMMLRQQLTPADFGIAVQKHPGALIITARNKMKNAASTTRVIGLAGRRLETTTLCDRTDDGDVPAKNLVALSSLADTVQDSYSMDLTDKGWPRWRAVDKLVVADFLDLYCAPSSDPIFGGPTLSKWVRGAKAKSLVKWDVVVARGADKGDSAFFGSEKHPIVRRSVIRRDGLIRVSGNSRRLAGSTDLEGILPPDLVVKVKSEISQSNDRTDKVQELDFYPHLERPTLFVYQIRPLELKEPIADLKLVALKVAIPGDSTNVRNKDSEIEYVINTVAQEQWLTEFIDPSLEDLDD